MHKTVKEALAKGKQLRTELDEKKEIEAKKRQERQKTEEAEKKAALQKEAEYYMSRLPDCLAQAVAERKVSFTLMTCESDCQNNMFEDLYRLLEPKLKKIGLSCKRDYSKEWVYLTFDPDTGYDATYYHLDVMVPEEGQ